MSPSTNSDLDNISTSPTLTVASTLGTSRSRRSTRTSVSGRSRTHLLPLPRGGSARSGSSAGSTIALPPEPDEPLPVKGWPQLARLMTDYPQTQGFPRFQELNVKNLLYYQVELTELAEQIRELEAKDKDKTRSEDGENYAMYADLLTASDSKQWKKVKRMRQTLKEYNEALLQFTQVSALPGPCKRNIDCLRDWIIRPDGGDLSIGGSGRHAWGNIERQLPTPPTFWPRLGSLVKSIFWPFAPARTKADLVTTHSPRRIDGCTQWIEDEFIPFWHYLQTPSNLAKGSGEGLPVTNEKASQQSPKPLKKNEKWGFEEYSERKMLLFTSWLTTIAACLLPTLAIAILATAEHNWQKFLYIGGFSVLFAIGLSLLAGENSRIQIFTATATFSAVMVVFVQNQ